MSDIPYVSADALLTSTTWERKIQSLPPDAGILFVSVSPRPESKGICRAYDVRVGIQRKFSEELGRAVVKHTLEEELKDPNYNIAIHVFRGVIGSATHEDPGRSSH